jgi:hypothetical protein
MARMKDLVMDILEDYENRIPISIIADTYEVSVEVVEQVIADYSTEAVYNKDKIGA